MAFWCRGVVALWRRGVRGVWGVCAREREGARARDAASGLAVSSSASASAASSSSESDHAAMMSSLLISPDQSALSDRRGARPAGAAAASPECRGGVARGLVPRRRVTETNDDYDSTDVESLNGRKTEIGPRVHASYDGLEYSTRRNEPSHLRLYDHPL